MMVKEDIKKLMTKKDMEQALIDNFINLQRVLTNLSVKFDELSGNIQKLLQLFEISAKSFAEKHPGKENEKQAEVDKEYLKKLDSLLDQNKTIAKGIMMMEEKVKGRMENPPQSTPFQQPEPDDRFKGMFKSKPLPRY